MALWLTALKLVPWVDVIEATPKIVQAARQLLGSKRTNKEASQITAAPEDAPLKDVAPQLQSRIEALENAQQASAVVIESLAEQNAQLVRAIESLRVTLTWLIRTVVTMGIIGLLIFWIRT
jgi:hypothetical protein